MPKDFRATTLERSIGRQLARWRDERGLSLAEAGQRVGFSSAKLSTMENAVQPSMPLDIMALGYVYNVPTPEWQAVVLRAEYAKTARMGGGRAEPLFDPTADFANLVFEATELRAFTTDLVPSSRADRCARPRTDRLQAAACHSGALPNFGTSSAQTPATGRIEPYAAGQHDEGPVTGSHWSQGLRSCCGG